MVCYVNGRFVAEEQALVSIHDRGFLYGDGLFESVAIYGSEPFLWREHTERLNLGAVALGIVPPLTAWEMRQVLRSLLNRNGMTDALARFTLSRGVGRRGYSPVGAECPTLAISLFPLPPKRSGTARIITSRFRLLANDALSPFKHCNKLVQVMARAEADAANADEAVLLNDQGHVVEGTSSNFFWVRGGKVFTAPVAEGILAGTTRSYILRLAKQCGFNVVEESRPARALRSVEGVFLTSSAIEISEVTDWDGRRIAHSPVVTELKKRYGRALAGGNL